MSAPDSQAVELGRTEVIYDNLNPEWAAQIVLTYLFEVQQTLIIRVRFQSPSPKGVLTTETLS
jgi:hypothetical protein